MLGRIKHIIQLPCRIAKRLAHYLGLKKAEPSPLTLTEPEETKKRHVRQVKRAQLLELIEGKGIDELRDILSSGPDGWRRYDHLRMNKDEVEGALKDHLYHLTKLKEEETVFYRRRMITGVGLVALGVCVPHAWRLIPKKKTRHYNAYYGDGGYDSGYRPSSRRRSSRR